MVNKTFKSQVLFPVAASYLDGLQHIALGRWLSSGLMGAPSCMLLHHRGCQDLGDFGPTLRVDLQQLAHEVDEVSAVLARCDGLEPARHHLGAQLRHGQGLKGDPTPTRPHHYLPHTHNTTACECNGQGAC